MVPLSIWNDVNDQWVNISKFFVLSRYNNAFAKEIYIKRWIHYYIISSCPLSSYQTLQKFIFVYATHSCTVNLSTICGGNVLRVGADLHSTQFQNSIVSLSLSLLPPPFSLLVTVPIPIYPNLSQRLQVLQCKPLDWIESDGCE